MIDPKLKPWIIGGAAVVGLAAIYFVLRSRGGSQADAGNGDTDGNGEPTPEPSKCKAPEVPCRNNPSLCYDPNINYIVDPCSTRGVSDYEDSGEPSFMPDK